MGTALAALLAIAAAGGALAIGQKTATHDMGALSILENSTEAQRSSFPSR